MKKSYRYYIQRLSFLSVLFFVFWLPLFEGYMPTIFGIMIGFWFLEGNFKHRFDKELFKSGIFISLLVYFVLSFVAVLYSTNQSKSWSDIQQKIALLAFPILIIGMSPYFWKNIRLVYWAFIIGLFTASVYNIILAIESSYLAGAAEGIFRFWVYRKHENVGFIDLIMMRMSYFSYGYFSQFLHPSYFSMQLVFSLPILNFLFKTKKAHNLFDKLAYFGLGLFFTLMIFFLQSTTGLISLVLVLLIMLYREFKSKYKKNLAFYLFSFSLVVFLLFGFTSLRQINLSDLGDSLSDSSSVRLDIWQNTYALWKDNPILGTGPSDVRAEIKTELFKKGILDFANGNYNMHNQFLESFIGLGIIGLITIIALLFFSLSNAIKYKSILLLYLISIIAVNFFFESILNRQSGLFFFLFFLSLLAFLPKPLKQS